MSRTYHHVGKKLISREYRKWLDSVFTRPFMHGNTEYFEIPRKLRRHALHWCHWWAKTPSWFHKLYHRRPRRRKDKHLCHMIAKGSKEQDLAFFSLNSKPEVWYW